MMSQTKSPAKDKLASEKPMPSIQDVIKVHEGAPEKDKLLWKNYGCTYDNVSKLWITPTEQTCMSDELALWAEQVLQGFLESKSELSESLRQADVTLTAREKELAAARERAEVAEQERKVKEEESRTAQRLLEDQKQALEKNMQQLREKFVQDQADIAQEHQKVLDQRLREQEKLQQEGFHARVGQMQREIDSLKGQKQEVASPSFLDNARDMATLVAPGFTKLIPLGIKTVKNLFSGLFRW
uniref:guanylate-binding protein 4-like n=1 Tax=Pristiophorus japonicus TaxID=55135 RepID=UPI00398EF092